MRTHVAVADEVKRIAVQRGCAVLLLTFASACSGGSDPLTAPTPSQLPAPSPATVMLTGQVADRATSAPIPGATVAVSYMGSLAAATTDSLGNYSLSGSPERINLTVWATAENYEADVHIYRSVSQDFRLYPIQRITAGDSTAVTVAPDAPLCVNEIDSPGWGADYVCRIVRIMATTDGIMTVEALPIHGEARPRLVVEEQQPGRPHPVSERVGNPTSIKVTAGTEVIAHVEMRAGSTTSQSFTLTTSMAQP